jgi:hypothetical protein
VVALDPVVRVPRCVVSRVGDQVGDDVRQRSGAVGDDLVGSTTREHRISEERPCSDDVAASGDEDVDDLAVLINGPLDVAPDAGDFDVGLVDEPPRPDRIPARSRGFDEQGRKSLHPSKQGDVIDLDTAFREELLEIAIRQPEALLRCSIAGDVERCHGAWSDGRCKFVECGGGAELTVSGFDSEFVVASPEVLHERVTADDDARSVVGLEAAHRS